MASFGGIDASLVLQLERSPVETKTQHDLIQINSNADKELQRIVDLGKIGMSTDYVPSENALNVVIYNVKRRLWKNSTAYLGVPNTMKVVSIAQVTNRNIW